MNGSLNSITVLQVDDDPDLADLTADMLEREDDRFRVETATSPNEGVKRLADGDFDCIVSDYQMPEMDGIEFLETVRSDHPELPFILFTGEGSEAVASEAIAAGVTDYLQKQRGTEQYELLANRVENAVEQYRANQRAANLQRIRTLVNEINQALVRASDRTEVESRVCEIISHTDPYLFAWIGEYDPETGAIEARTSEGAERGYLDAVEIAVDESATGQGPTARTVRSHEVNIVQSIPDAEEYEPWRAAALDRGYRSSAAIPLVYDGNMLGVLNVYADRTWAFDERERELLAELGDDIVHAIHHQEVKRTLRRERDRFQHLVSEIEHYAIFLINPDGYVSTWNAGAEQIKGYTEDEILGAHYRTFFPEEAVEKGTPERLLVRAAETGSVTGEGWRVRRDGREFWADYTLTALEGDSGDLRGFAKVTRNMTDQRRREQELARQNRRLDEFASIITHDLRNPLNVAEGRVELAHEDCDSEHLDCAADAIERSIQLVDDVLALTREGRESVDVEQISLEDLVEESWQTIETEEARLVVDAERRLRADRSRFKQLLENLLGNAVKHGPDGVTVTIGTMDDGLYVEDDGPGIPEDESDEIFESGYSTEEEGTGLGLPIVQKIAGAHGWDIGVTDGDNGGARFEITGVEFID